MKVVSVLIERLNDPNESVSKAVLGALEAITGKKMSKSFPRDEKSLQCLIARWNEWRKDKQREDKPVSANTGLEPLTKPGLAARKGCSAAGNAAIAASAPHFVRDS